MVLRRRAINRSVSTPHLSMLQQQQPSLASPGGPGLSMQQIAELQQQQQQLAGIQQQLLAAQISENMMGAERDGSVQHAKHGDGRPPQRAQSAPATPIHFPVHACVFSLPPHPFSSPKLGVLWHSSGADAARRHM
jgi:hypothetical protein